MQATTSDLGTHLLIRCTGQIVILNERKKRGVENNHYCMLRFVADGKIIIHNVPAYAVQQHSGTYVYKER